MPQIFHRHVWALGLLVLALAACSTTSSNRYPGRSAEIPNPHKKIGNPYVIDGVRYVPREDIGYDAIGIASWYGPNFHGKLTANGEIFDMDRLTAAHKTLPLPSLVKVTNLENGRSVTVRLNDRGPFAGNRIIDLSRATAERLGTREKGLARVRVQYLGPASLDHAIVRVGDVENYAALEPPARPQVVAMAAPIAISAPPEARRDPVSSLVHRASWEEPIVITRESDPGPVSIPDIKASFYVQVGAYSSLRNAEAAIARLPEVVPVQQELIPFGDQALHQIRLGPYEYEFAALEAERVAKESGFLDAHVVHESGAE